jgi:hypothetical protein
MLLAELVRGLPAMSGCGCCRCNKVLATNDKEALVMVQASLTCIKGIDPSAAAADFCAPTVAKGPLGVTGRAAVAPA